MSVEGGSGGHSGNEHEHLTGDEPVAVIAVAVLAAICLGTIVLWLVT